MTTTPPTDPTPASWRPVPGYPGYEASDEGAMRVRRDVLAHFSADERLAMAGECVHGTLRRIPEFPCRMDEMSEREAAIAEIACNLVGVLQFLASFLPDLEEATPP